MTFCVFCKNESDAWIPHHVRHPGVSASEFIIRAGSVGSNGLRMWCPICLSFDRERHLKLFFDKLEIWPLFKGGVLHMAPEHRLREVLRGYAPARYVQGDLTPTEEGVEKIDLEAIGYEDGAFDVVIANHMLEHVVNPHKALSEVRRVLRSGGRFICQTPYAAKLSRTFEDPAITSSEDRMFFYAQDDHLRLFGTDIVEIIRSAGFKGELRPHDDLLPGLDPELYGVNEREPFFDFVSI